MEKVKTELADKFGGADRGGAKKISSGKGMKADPNRSFLANSYVAAGKPNFEGKLYHVPAVEAQRAVEKAEIEKSNKLIATKAFEGMSNN